MYWEWLGTWGNGDREYRKYFEEMEGEEEERKGMIAGGEMRHWVEVFFFNGGDKFIIHRINQFERWFKYKSSWIIFQISMVLCDGDIAEEIRMVSLWRVISIWRHWTKRMNTSNWMRRKEEWDEDNGPVLRKVLIPGVTWCHVKSISYFLLLWDIEVNQKWLETGRPKLKENQSEMNVKLSSKPGEFTNQSQKRTGVL